MRALVLLIITMASFNAYAQGIKIDLGLSELDLSLKFGAMFGKIQSDSNKAAGTQDFGGFVAGGVFSFDQSGNWTLFISPEAAFDAVNKSAIRKGAQAGFIYHLLGGSKKVTTPLYNATITTSYPASLGIVGKSGYFDYSVIDPQNLLPSTRGTVIENSLGIDFRYDRPSGSSFGGQISTLLASVPSGTENLKTSSVMEILTYWRSSF
jgi:hypothetical protein